MLERNFFKNGMSVAELLSAYSQGLAFSEQSKWVNGKGFCFHSDQAIAYFVNYYHVAVPQEIIQKIPIDDFMRMKYLGFINFNNTKKNEQCAFTGDKCNATSSAICHYMTPQQMIRLWDSRAET